MCGNLKGGNEAHGQVRKRLSTIPAYLLPLLRLLASSFPSVTLPLLLYVLSLFRDRTLPFILSLRSMGAFITHAHANILASHSVFLPRIYPDCPLSFPTIFLLCSFLPYTRIPASIFHVHDSWTPRNRILIHVYHPLQALSHSLSRISFLLLPFFFMCNNLLQSVISRLIFFFASS